MTLGFVRPAGAAGSYRPDVDGLRAIAVLAVVLYHFFPGAAPGGYVGVDIFFVISGYLISSIIINELNDGRFSFMAFYRRRARRIFPALVVVLAASAAFGWFVLFDNEFKSLGKHVLASSAFVLNFVLWRETGYFEVESGLKPLLHLWSLSVEEQFYVVWPLLLWLAWKRKRAVFALALAAGVASFFVNAWGVSRYSMASFFLMPARFWEFLAGFALAYAQASSQTQTTQTGLLAHGRRLLAGDVPAGIGNVLAVAGLLLLAAGIYFLDGNDPYPGWRAMLPVAGTFLLIATGPISGIGKLLGSRGLVFTGLISYPLYLWHWPLLAFARIILDDPAFHVKCGLLLLAFVLAWGTYEFVEKPVRFSRENRRIKLGFVVGALVLMAFLGVLMTAKEIRSRLTYAMQGARVKITEAQQDWGYPDNGGRQSNKVNMETRKVEGDDSKGLLLIGDSHVKQYWSRFEYLNSRDRSLGSVTFAPSVCPPLPNIRRISEEGLCYQLFDQAMALAADSNIRHVIFGAYWEAYLIGHYGRGEKNYIADVADSRDPENAPLKFGEPRLERIFDEFRQAIATLIGAGKRVTIILSNPTGPAYEPGKMIVSRMSLKVEFGTEFFVPKKEFVAFVSPVMDRLRRIARETGAEIVDPVDYLCSEEKCLATKDGLPIYMDGNHLRASYVRDHADFLDGLYVR
ncbi:MAG: acyltransferase family protein [Pseudomonadota bacterium]